MLKTSVKQMAIILPLLLKAAETEFGGTVALGVTNGFEPTVALGFDPTTGTGEATEDVTTTVIDDEAAAVPDDVD